MTFEKVSKVLADNRGISQSEITPDTTLEDLGLDSLDTFEIVMTLEEEFNITIDTNDPIKKVSDLVDLIDNMTK